MTTRLLSFEAYEKNAKLKKMLLVAGIVVLCLMFILQTVPVIVYAYDATKDDEKIATIPDDITAEEKDIINSYNVNYKKSVEGNSEFAGAAFWMATTGKGINPTTSISSFGEAILAIRGMYAKNSKGEKLYLFGDTGYMGMAYNALRVTGIIIMLLYFFLSIVDKITSEQLSTELFIRKIIGLAICLLLILNGARILDGILDWSTALITDTSAFMKSFTYGATDAKGYYEWLSDFLTSPKGTISKFLAALGIFLSSIIPFLAQLALTVIVFIVGISRFLEIAIRYMFAPIGIAPIVHDGMRSSGAKYIKKFAACCLNGAVIICITYLATALPSFFASLGDVFKFLAQVALPLAAIALIFRCQNIADEIMGVH